MPIGPQARKVEAALNKALSEYDAASHPDTREFYLLKTQVVIFYYDVVASMLSVGRNKPSGFAKSVRA